MSAGYRILPHPSDVGFEVWAPDWPALLDQAVRALAEVETGGNTPAPTASRALPEVEEGEDGLVEVLERCLLELDADNWLAVAVAGGALQGTELTDEARANGTHVKAVTWHQLALVREPAGLRATVFVDL